MRKKNYFGLNIKVVLPVIECHLFLTSNLLYATPHQILNYSVYLSVSEIFWKYADMHRQQVFLKTFLYFCNFENLEHGHLQTKIFEKKGNHFQKYF